MDQENATQHLLRKLNQVFKDGYRPARGNESYNVKLENGVKAYTMVNCLGHVLNLRNQQFNEYHIKPYPLFSNFPGLYRLPKDKAVPELFNFIKATGLKVEECDPKETITDFKSWKFALYFAGCAFIDVHFLLEDTTHKWTSKCGFRNNFEQLNLLTPPLIYKNQINRGLPDYDFYGTYKITNPNASESNRYVKGHYTQERSM